LSSYKFRDLGKYTGSDEFIPSEAMYVFWKGSYKLIENLITGYQTLNVTGRELFSRNVSVENLNGSDGGMYTNSNYPQRVIKVKFKLKAESNEDFRRMFEYLNLMLSQEQFKFKFEDDPQFYWIGTISAVDDFPEGTNEGVGTFEITCSSPFKRMEKAINNKGVGSVKILEPIYFLTVPDVIEIELSKDVSQLTVSNELLQIELNGPLKANDVVDILPDMADSPILVNGVDKTGYLNYLSDLENFEVGQDDVIACSDSKANINVKIRSRRL